MPSGICFVLQVCYADLCNAQSYRYAVVTRNKYSKRRWDTWVCVYNGPNDLIVAAVSEPEANERVNSQPRPQGAFPLLWVKPVPPKPVPKAREKRRGDEVGQLSNREKNTFSFERRKELWLCANGGIKRRSMILSHARCLSILKGLTIDSLHRHATKKNKFEIVQWRRPNLECCRKQIF